MKPTYKVKQTGDLNIFYMYVVLPTCIMNNVNTGKYGLDRPHYIHIYLEEYDSKINS